MVGPDEHGGIARDRGEPVPARVDDRQRQAAPVRVPPPGLGVDPIAAGVGAQERVSGAQQVEQGGDIAATARLNDALRPEPALARARSAH
ncbi:hypothetical protein BGP79_11075 [Tersicoccus sp. Bi-70]|nr:hypothetical protein BGP79_11075 [Tersicoccus sp. Bi-70]